MVFVFSGTGNSQYVARRIAAALGHEVRSINDALRGAGLATAGLPSAEALVFVCPTYAWRLPRAVCDWIARTDFGPGREAYFVLTCGAEIGNAAPYIEALCRRRRLAYRGCAQVVMPENYIVLFDAPAPAEAHAIVEGATATIDDIARRIVRGDDLVPPHATPIDRIKSGLANPLFYALCVKTMTPRASAACVGCGACVSRCPFENVRLEEGRPVWGNRCTHCMACVSICPHAAIECGPRTKGKMRYRFPG